MRCNKCNTEVSNNEKYCYKCGNKVENTNSINLQKEDGNHSNTNSNNTYKNVEDTTFGHIGTEVTKNSKKAKSFLKENGEKVVNKVINLNKLQKILILSISVLFIAGVTVVSIPQTQEKVINQFEEAIINDNPSKLKKIMISSDKRLNISQDSLGLIIQYYKENPSNLNNDIQYLREMYPVEGSTDNNSPFSIVSKKVLFKEKYYIGVNPRYIQLESTYKDAKIDLYSGKDLIEEDLKGGEIGPFLPGKYKLVISCDNEFAKTKASKEIDLFYGELTNYIDMEGTINNNKINSNEAEAIIYVNHKSTGKTAREIKTISGLNDGDTVYGILKYKGKSIKSNMVEIIGSSDIYLSYEYTKPPSSDEVKDSVSTLIYDYLYYFADAVNYNDFSYIEDYLSVGSDLYNEQKSNVPKFYEKGVSERYVNHEIINFDYNEDEGKGSITVKEVYEITKDDEQKEKVFNNKYQFIFNDIDKTYKLTKLEMIEK